jgi:hypothetical protein
MENLVPPTSIARVRFAGIGFAGIGCQTSSGDAVPVPFFMIVMEATRLPKRAASAGEPVTRRASDAPAEKLSPAPQISTGSATGRVRTHVRPIRSTIRTPAAAFGHEHQRRFRVAAQKRRIVHAAEQFAAGALGLLPIWFDDDVAEQVDARARIGEEDAYRDIAAPARQAGRARRA